MSDKPELKSCPFCGEIPVTTYIPPVIDGAPAIYCKGCDYALSMLTATHALVIEKWNRRTPSIPQETRSAELAERLKQEARNHSSEVDTLNGIIGEIYQAVTGKTGEPGNWNGARPIVEALEKRDALVRELVGALHRSNYELLCCAVQLKELKQNVERNGSVMKAIDGGNETLAAAGKQGF